MQLQHGEPTPATRQANQQVRLSLPFSDRQDFDDARRGFVATLSPLIVKGTGGRVAWDMESYAFLDGECPATVNPSLWRQAQLNAIHGLFEDGDAVVMTWLWAATHLGDIPGFPATGKRIHMSGATVYFLENGRFTGHWQITDRLGVYAQLRQAQQDSGGGRP